MKEAATHSHAGYFWRPHEKKQLAGKLIIEKNGSSKIEGVGDIQEYKNPLEAVFITTQDPSIGTLHGYVENLGFVTLKDCMRAGSGASVPDTRGPEIVRFQAHVGHIFSGHLFAPNEEPSFTRIRFSIQGLQEWLGTSGFKYEIKHGGRGGTLSYGPPKDISFDMGYGRSLKFIFGFKGPSFPILDAPKLSQSVYAEITSEDEMSFSNLLKDAKRVENLLAFVIDENVSILETTCYNERLTRDLGSTSIPVEVKTFYRKRDPSVIGSLHPFLMLLPFSDAKTSFQDIVTNWFMAYSEIEPALNLYFASRSGSYGYLENRFLSLVQGIETFHRRTAYEVTFNENEWKEISDSLRATCPKFATEWLDIKLKYGNEIPLRKRIQLMIAPFKVEFGNSKRRSWLCSKTANSRNYLTHYSEDLEQEMATDEELWSICHKLEALFQMHILLRLGLSTAEILKICKTNQSIQWKLKEA